MQPASSSDAQDSSRAVRDIESTLGRRLQPEVREEFSKVEERVRRAVEVEASRSLSVAIVDRTTVWRTTRLVGGQPEAASGSADFDPFLAFADLATILGAVMFDERVVVLGDSQIAPVVDYANELLGLDDERVIRALSVYPDSYEELERDPAVAVLMQEPLLSAQRELVHASTTNAAWLKSLSRKWAELLPGVAFPAYDEAAFLNSIDAYTNMPWDLYSLFALSRGDWGDEWKLEPFVELIIDNDVRALYYERVVQCITAMTRRTGNDPVVHYVGGCLRSPMFLARAEYAAGLGDSTTMIGRLQRSWQAARESGPPPLRRTLKRLGRKPSRCVCSSSTACIAVGSSSGGVSVPLSRAVSVPLAERYG